MTIYFFNTGVSKKKIKGAQKFKIKLNTLENVMFVDNENVNQ